MIPFFSSYVSPTAIDRVSEVLRSGMLSEGKMVRKFEQEFENVFNLPDNTFVAVNSGTSALHLALETLGVKGEVLLPANTFVATGLAVLMAGCKPVFCDIGADGNIDPWDAEERITPQTSAILAVNWAGKLCNLKMLEKLCAEYDLKLIIDGAQSLGVRVGGDATCYSFQATKHLTTGDGGGVWFNRSEDYRRGRELRWFGISKNSSAGLLGEREYDLDRVGYKYHMNDYAAALGLANLEDIGKRLSYYDEIAGHYMRNLRYPVPMHESFWDNSFWAFPIRVDDNRRFAKFCRERGVPCSVIHRGIDYNSLFGGPYHLPVQREWEKTVTHLPIHMDITLEDVAWIVNQVNEYV